MLLPLSVLSRANAASQLLIDDIAANVCRGGAAAFAASAVGQGLWTCLPGVCCPAVARIRPSVTCQASSVRLQTTAPMGDCRDVSHIQIFRLWSSASEPSKNNTEHAKNKTHTTDSKCSPCLPGISGLHFSCLTLQALRVDLIIPGVMWPGTRPAPPEARCFEV
jgi:hypothetical protein